MLVKSRVKYIQSLGQKKGRDDEGVFIAEGPKIISELLSSPACTIQAIYAVKEWIDQQPQPLHGIEVMEVSEDELGKISQLITPNQVIAIIKKFAIPAIHTKNTISLVLDTIQDPGNLGTIIRTADWFGFTQVICSTGCADLYNPKVVQATMGSIARVKLLYTDLLSWLATQQDIRIYGAALDGMDVSSLQGLTEGIIVIGNESKGISEEIMNLVQEKITIKGKGNAESLNAAVATGIILSKLV
jgi:TrmH family RNA methyltransferase